MPLSKLYNPDQKRFGSMTGRVQCFVATLVLSLPTLKIDCAPVDLSPPKNALGSADNDGYLRYAHRFGDVQFSDNFSIPLRFDFSSRRIVESEKSRFGWHGWACGVVESTASIQQDKLLKVQLLCAKIMMLSPKTGEAGRYATPDGVWTGLVDGNQISISREDGWVLRFVDGRVDRLTTDKGREINWLRDGKGRVVAIQEKGTTEPQLTLAWRDDGYPETLATGPTTYQFRFEKESLAAIESALSSGQKSTFEITLNQNSIQLKTSKLSGFHFTWDPKTGILLRDGSDKYLLTNRRTPGGGKVSQVLSMTSPDGSVATHEIGSRSGETRHINKQGQEVVTTRATSERWNNGAVSKVELIRDGAAPLLLMAHTFDEKGRLQQRIWMGEAILYSGYHNGTVEQALLPDREGKFPLDAIPEEGTISVIQFSYSESDQLQNVVANGEEVIRFDYDDQNRLVRTNFKNRYDKTYTYADGGNVTETLVIPESEKGPFWFLESESEGVGPNLVITKTEDSSGRLLSQRFADGRTLTVEYDTKMRRIGDLTTAPDGKTPILQVTYVHSPQDGSALRITEDLLTGEKKYADIGVYGIGKDIEGRKLPEEMALHRSGLEEL